MTVNNNSKQQINKLTKAIHEELKEVEIWGNGEARREFMYASDLADAIYYALDRFDKMPQILNIGVGEDHTINEYYSVVAKVIGYEGDIVFDSSKPDGNPRKLLDSTLINSLGWNSSMKLEEGLSNTFSWFKENII